MMNVTNYELIEENGVLSKESGVKVFGKFNQRLREVVQLVFLMVEFYSEQHPRLFCN
jgi:hypothetical protein